MVHSPIPFAVVTAAVLVHSAAWADDLPVPLDPALTEPAALHYDYEPGTSLRYRVTVDLYERLSNIPDNRSDDKRLQGTVDLVIAVRPREADQNILLHEELQNASITAETDGESTSPRRVVRALEGTIRGLEIDPTGQVLDEEVSPLAEAEGFDPLVAAVRQWCDLFTAAQLSDGPVSVGDSWVSEGILSSQRPLEAYQVTDQVTFTFLGYAHLDGGVAAVLAIDLETWWELGEGESVGAVNGPALFRGVGHGIVYFDPNRGHVIQGNVEYGRVGQFGDPSRRSDMTHTASVEIELL